MLLPPLPSSFRTPETSSVRTCLSESRTETLPPRPSSDRSASPTPCSYSREISPLPHSRSLAAIPCAPFPVFADNISFGDRTAHSPLPARDTADTDSRSSDYLPHTPELPLPDTSAYYSSRPR